MAGTDTDAGVESVEVLILGAGLCGVAAAIGQKQAGIDDVVIVERSDGVGGPGASQRLSRLCGRRSIPRVSFSFALKPDWSLDLTDRDVVAIGTGASVIIGLRRLHIRPGEPCSESRRETTLTAHFQCLTTITVSRALLRDAPRVFRGHFS
jgi:hypothetical protein